MSNVELNCGQFSQRCARIRERLDVPLIVMLGKAADVEDFGINSAVFHYLLGYEFPETLIVIDREPIAIVSAKKALILQQIENMRIIIKGKDEESLTKALSELTGFYGVIGQPENQSEFCKKVLSMVRTKDVTDDVSFAMAVKDSNEIEYMKKCGQAANYLLQKGIELIRDINFSKEVLENYMNMNIRGINSALIEYAFDPEDTPNHLRLGIRYRGYCVDVARPFMMDLEAEYDAQQQMLALARPGVSSKAVLDGVRKYCADKGYSFSLRLYLIGLLHEDRDFEKDFILEQGMTFCLNIGNEFCNTFLLDKTPVFITRKDTKEDYSESRMRFRNRGNDQAMVSRMNEHQKELLNVLVEERTAYYKSHSTVETESKKPGRRIVLYSKDAAVPRAPGVFLDWDHFYAILPILSYSVPFHISTVKNGSITADGRLRLNFKESRLEDEREQDGVAEALHSERTGDSTIKSITLRVANSDELLSQINEMKKEFSRPKLSLKEQGSLREKPRKYALMDLYLKTDNKTGTKRTVGNLELHENGFKYNETIFLFSIIKNVFYESGDFENRAVIHFHLSQPISVAGKPTQNLQFFRKLNLSCYDTSKREDERAEMMRQEEEEQELTRINNEFLLLCDRIESETTIRVQTLERGFLGVHAKEAVHISSTSECLVSIADQPFFILNFEDIEIANLERVTPVTKTFDCVFVFKDKARPTVQIGSIESTRLGFVKELLDSHNILFTITKVNINWPNVIATIVEDPVRFYENGAWAELLYKDEDEDESSGLSSGSTETEATTVGSTSEEESVSSDKESSAVSTEDSGFVCSEDEDDDSASESESSDSSYSTKRKRRR